MKLSTLVREHLGASDVGEIFPFAPGAGLVEGARAWVLLDEQPARGLGPALVWAERAGAVEVHVLAESDTGLLARRAEMFTVPPTIWTVVDRALHQAEAAPLPDPPTVPGAHEAMRSLIEAGGAEPIVEHGVLAGEVAGLEVCRVVTDPDTGVARLEVGTGAHDREAFQLLHGDVPTVEALADVVATVAEHRRPGAAAHPLNRLAAERALRHRLVQEPALVGADWLDPAPPPVPRPNLKDPVPCVALGSAPSGALMVVVCSTGIDLDLVPFAADARAALAPDADLVLALPARDVVGPTARLAGALRRPARIVPIP
jgi:hypothetical protein